MDADCRAARVIVCVQRDGWCVFFILFFICTLRISRGQVAAESMSVASVVVIAVIWAKLIKSASVHGVDCLGAAIFAIRQSDILWRLNHQQGATIQVATCPQRFNYNYNQDDCH